MLADDFFKKANDIMMGKPEGSPSLSQMTVFGNLSAGIDEDDEDDDDFVSIGPSNESNDTMIVEYALDLSKNIESVTIVTLQEENVSFETKMQLANVTVDSLTELEFSFINFCYSEDYSIIGGSNCIVDSFNENFKQFRVNSNDEAMWYFISIRYSVFLKSYEVFTKFKTVLTPDFLECINLPYRIIEDNEIELLSNVYKESWFSADIIKMYSLDVRCTELLVQCMRNFIIDRQYLDKYSVDNDQFYCYLRLLLTGNFVEAYYDRVIRDGWDLYEYVDISVESKSPELKEVLANRDDYVSISNAVGDYKLVFDEEPTELIKKYADACGLADIIKAASKGIINHTFIDKYLIDDCIDHVSYHYGIGKFPTELLDRYDGDYYKCVISVEVEQWLSIRVIENWDYFKPIMVKLVNSRYGGNISSQEYRQFIYVVSEFPEIVESLIVYLADGKYSFNRFWLERLLSTLSLNVSLNDTIGKTILLSFGDSKSQQCTVDDFLYNSAGFLSICANCDEANVLNSNTGIVLKIPRNDKKNYKSTFTLEPSSYTSMELWASGSWLTSDSFELQHANYFAFLRFSEERGVKKKEEIDYFKNLSIKDYLKYDRVFNMLLTQMDDFAWIPASELASVLIASYRVSCPVTNKGQFLYIFVERALYSLLLSKLKYNREGFADLQNTRKPEMSVNGYAYKSKLTIKDFVDNFDKIADTAISAKSVDLFIKNKYSYLTIN